MSWRTISSTLGRVVALVLALVVGAAVATSTPAAAQQAGTSEAVDRAAPTGAGEQAGPAEVSPLTVTGPVAVDGVLSAIERDVGASTALSDGNRLWAFGDSYGGGFHTSTAAFTTPGAPNTLVEPFDANGDRYELIPHTADEAAFDRGLRFHAIDPTRLADTRDATGDRWPVGRAAGPLTPADALWLDLDAHPALAGMVGGGAVVLNITGVNTVTGSTFTHLSVGQVFTAFTTSTLNLAPGEVAANLTTLSLGLGGIVGVRTNSGATHVVVDLLGWYDAAHTVAGANGGTTLQAISPQRAIDTGHAAPLRAGQPRLVAIGGAAAPVGATAALVNVTADAPTADTHLTVWPAGTAPPPTSNLNLPAGTTRANLAVVRLGDGGAIAMSTSSGATRAIVDVVGWYGPGATGDLVPVTPIRLLDTRPSGAPLTTAGRTITLDRHHVPAGARAALVNLTAVGASTGMHLTAWAGGQAQPPTSNLNLPAGATRPNLALVPLDAQGRATLRTSAGAAHVLVDLLGFVGAGASVPDPCPTRAAGDPRPYVALWPQSIVAIPAGPGHDAVHIWYVRETVCTSTTYVHGDVGVAVYDHRPAIDPIGSAPIVAERRNDHLFTTAERYAWGRGGILDGGAVHLFGCDPSFDLACRRTVAPAGGDLTVRPSYVDDPSDLDLPPNLAAQNPPAGISVEWVPALGLYTMLYLPPPWPSDTVLLRTATDLAGPWSDPIAITLPGCSSGDDACYTPRVRPDRSTATSLAFTYFDMAVTADPIFNGRLLTARLPVAVVP
ncbi:MAG: hypothetical protein KDB36_04010 [Acidimicrobiales bacterium]|nr:hypothetical protein [Acidimicrobiales bacterium]